MKIQDIPAGREMDILVSKTIFPSFGEKLFGGLGIIPAYSTSIACAWEMEEHIFNTWNRGDIEAYCDELNQLANSAWREMDRLPQKWQLIHATPEERCRAALMAVGGDA